MPTKPEAHLLNRDLSAIKPLVDLTSPVLQEAINYATTAYQRSFNSEKGKTDEAYPPLANYLHIIQLTDSVEILVSNGCGPPAELLLRSIFEAILSLEYLLESDTARRGIAWTVKNMVDRIESVRCMIPESKKGKELHSAFINEGFADLIQPPKPVGLDKEINHLENELKTPKLNYVYLEYLKCVNPKNKYPEWYSLYNGPYNLRELAKHLNKESTYLTLYSTWSKMAHFNDAAHLTVNLGGEGSVLGPIRNPQNLIHIGATALSRLIDATIIVTKHFTPYYMNNFIKWYGKEIREKHVRLVNLELSDLAQYESNIHKSN